MTPGDNQPDALAAVPATAHRRRDLLLRARLWLCWLATAGVGLFWWADHGLRGQRRYHPGRLTAAHASWDGRCDACHKDSMPLAGDNWLGCLTGRNHGADAACQACHAGPPHHVIQGADAEPACPSCHREHQGRQAALTRVADFRCIECHRDMADHVADRPGKLVLDITTFTVNHPEFRVLRHKAIDPGTIAFDHRLHMKAGLRDDADHAAPFTLADIPLAVRERYRRRGQATDYVPVQLECRSCHRTDPGDLSLRPDDAQGLPFQALHPARASGTSMAPILYERHCQACHPLTFEARPTYEWRSEPVAIRHRLQPAEVSSFLEGHYARKFLGNSLDLLQRPLRPLPGKNPNREEEETVGARIAESVRRAEKVLFGSNTCGLCHGPVTDQGRIPPSAIPQVWFAHARFDHTAHRAVDCRTCHANAYALHADGTPNRHASTRNADVLLPGIETCRACHSQADASKSHGGARFDCVQCHRYHGGDQPLHGRGAALRGPGKK